MSLVRLCVGRSLMVCGFLAAGLLVADFARAAGPFPFDQDLLLDAAPLRPGKRMPMLTVAPNGDATIGLWCKTVTARVELSDDGIKIEPGALPEALPDMMGRDQCTPKRMEADAALLAAFAQITAWRTKGAELVLEGPLPLKFRPATN